MGSSPVVNRINALLAEKGIRKQDFYQDCGITSASYSLWNTGKTTPRMKNLEVIAAYLGTTTDYLLTGLGAAKKPARREELMAAFWGGEKDLSPEDMDSMWMEVEKFAAFVADQKRKEKQE
ncbi:MAG: helix-turn-helix domain-containing protein [Oscillospiraceae bacterium]|nr:helix-turn-helix domain-containing protein [Oscillospiraceae bacterium]